jgi:hypothetical protein
MHRNEELDDNYICSERLAHLGVSAQRFQRPVEVVGWLGALQAQDYPGALWAIALRLPDATVAHIEGAIADRSIVRTWPMRGTLHFVSAEDIHWMRRLLAPKAIAVAAARRGALGLLESDFARCENVFLKELSGGRQLTRDSLYAVMSDAAVSPDNQRGMHIIRHLAMDGLLCFGSHEGKQPSFALLNDWCPETKVLSHDESLAQLAHRYFTSHGPATIDDLVRWAGLNVRDVKTGIELASDVLTRETIKGKFHWTAQGLRAASQTSPLAHLLPGFDEYMLGYKDRSFALAPEHANAICPGNNGIFIATIVIDGAVVGTWSKTDKKNTVQIKLNPFEPLTDIKLAAIQIAADRYGRFMSKKAEIV